MFSHNGIMQTGLQACSLRRTAWLARYGPPNGACGREVCYPRPRCMLICCGCTASCAGVTCSAGKSCIVDQLGLPHCLRCDVLDYCPWDSADRSPVCGADGRTYAGRCRLLEAACRLGRSVRLAYRGRCRGITVPYSCPCHIGYGSRHSLSQQGCCLPVLELGSDTKLATTSVCWL